MPNEITVSTSLQLANGKLIVNSINGGFQADQATAKGGGPGTVDVGTSEQTIDFGDIAPGFVELRNLDDTNFVELGFSTGVYGIRLIADGGPALFYLNTGATLYAKADTAGCAVQITAVNS